MHNSTASIPHKRYKIRHWFAELDVKVVFMSMVYHWIDGHKELIYMNLWNTIHYYGILFIQPWTSYTKHPSLILDSQRTFCTLASNYGFYFDMYAMAKALILLLDFYRLDDFIPTAIIH